MILRDPPDSRDRYFVGGAAPRPAAASLAPWLLKKENQQRVNACGGFGASSLMEVLRHRWLGIREELSQLFPWQIVKEWAGQLTLNVGVSSRGIVKALEKYGIPPESAWPFDPAKQGVRPPPAVFKLAKKIRIKSYQRCVTLDQAKAAIAAGFPVFVGMQLRTGFPEIGPGYLAREPIGGHFMVLVGYRPDGLLELWNSWDDGLILVPEVVLNVDAWDMWAVTGIKTLRERAMADAWAEIEGFFKWKG